MNAIAGVLFDKDGVLIDFHATWGPATARAIRHVAADEAQAQALAAAVEFDFGTECFAPSSAFIAGTAEDSIQAWSQAPGADRELAERISTKLLDEGIDCAAAPPEAAPALQALRASGLRLGIATNDMERSARRQMDVLGLADLFDPIMGADSGHGAKPEPGMILAFAAHLGMDPSRIAMVGDSLHDLDAARAAGAVAVAIGTGPASLATLAPHADHAIGTLTALPDLIADLNSR